ncbi:hypothetical protein SAMN05444349_12158 [Bacteroides faecichinchillae]|uniref:Uncharacterized protein n=1 Tax=Bacteroides faecichinchillae TaxID=871325 RepID=A0A1M5C002_9BACE|nr:hypothetical protein SAMN05444349_12158 [Bacteroides faecichinchillae]
MVFFEMVENIINNEFEVRLSQNGISVDEM